MEAQKCDGAPAVRSCAYSFTFTCTFRPPCGFHTAAVQVKVKEYVQVGAFRAFENFPLARAVKLS